MRSNWPSILAVNIGTAALGTAVGAGVSWRIAHVTMSLFANLIVNLGADAIFAGAALAAAYYGAPRQVSGLIASFGNRFNLGYHFHNLKWIAARLELGDATSVMAYTRGNDFRTITDELARDILASSGRAEADQILLDRFNNLGSSYYGWFPFYFQQPVRNLG